MKIFYSSSEEETVSFGRKIAGFLKPSEVVALIGELGTGKTTFTKGVGLGLGVRSIDTVLSPSFVLLKEYKGRIPLYHFDLYRLDKMERLEQFGYEEYFYGKGISIIEWAEKAESLLPTDYLKIELFHKKINERLIKVSAVGLKFKDLVKKI
jgi:tRNA threonylcarbamoyladenosine biosynthesis protein TsaE